MSGFRSWHVWTPGLDPAAGGIQNYSSRVADVLRRAGIAADFFSKNDRPSGAARAFGRWPGPLRTGAFAPALFFGAMRERPAGILCLHLNFAPLALAVKRRLGIGYRLLLYGAEIGRMKPDVFARCLAEADRIGVISGHTLDSARKKIPATTFEASLLPPTCDFEAFVPGTRSGALLKRFGIPEKARVVLTVCRTDASESYKGYDRILDALPRVMEAVPDVHYVLAGHGDDLSRVRSIVRDRNLSGRVTLTGFVPAAELPDWYRSCDLFAMPSEGEGFGIVYLEAMACGKICLAGLGDGGRDALDGGRLGILADPRDPEGLAAAVVRGLDAAPRTDAGRVRSLALERFGPEAFAGRWKDFLR